MASDNHRSFARIGFTIFAGLTAIVGTLIYLGGIRGQSDELLAETYYDKPVSGLSVGSVVNFRGVKIGEVREIAFVGNKYNVEGADNSRIYILLALKKNLMERENVPDEEFSANMRMLVEKRGMRATVTASGITGLSRIECDFNPPENLDDDEPEVSWTPEHVYIPAKMSLLDNFSDSAVKVMNQIDNMDFDRVWSNITVTVESLARMSQSGQTMLEARQGDIERIVDDLTATVSALRGLSAELRNNPSLLVRERKQARLQETE